MAGPLTTLTAELLAVVEDPELGHIGGAVAKEIALDEAERDLGADRAMSGFRRVVPLRAGYDIRAGGIDLNLYPEGVWILASEGRRAKSYKVIPRLQRRGRRRRSSSARVNAGARQDRRRVAIMTPRGPRYSARIVRSRALGTIDRVERRLTPEVGRALDEHLVGRLSKVGR